MARAQLPTSGARKRRGCGGFFPMVRASPLRVVWVGWWRGFPCVRSRKPSSSGQRDHGHPRVVAPPRDPRCHLDHRCDGPLDRDCATDRVPKRRLHQRGQIQPTESARGPARLLRTAHAGGFTGVQMSHHEEIDAGHGRYEVPRSWLSRDLRTLTSPPAVGQTPGHRPGFGRTSCRQPAQSRRPVLHRHPQRLGSDRCPRSAQPLGHRAPTPLGFGSHVSGRWQPHSSRPCAGQP